MLFKRIASRQLDSHDRAAGSAVVGKYIRVVVWLIAGVIGFVHLWRLDTVPQGIYVDESSIGLNAATIAENLHDEHGRFLPVYFEAFGDYKNPLYVYTVAALFKFFGVSVWTLHVTSVFYFAIFVAGVANLSWRLFPGRRGVLLYALIAAGTMPWLFTLSRISFEVISQPAVWIWTLYFVFRTYQSADSEQQWYKPATAGLLSGLSVYTYSTSRLLTFGLVVAVMVTYSGRVYRKRHGLFLSATAAALIPYGLFYWWHPGTLSARFKVMSYFYDHSMSLVDKVERLITRYCSYFSPGFLILHGDRNLRHHTGMNGELFMTMAALAVIGLGLLFYRLSDRNRRFGLFLFLNLLVAPLPAALTEPSGHSLRSLLIAVYLLVFSIYGFAAITRSRNYRWRVVATGVLFATLILEATDYLEDYFVKYPSRSAEAFESYNFPIVLSEALSQRPIQVIVSKNAGQPYAHLDFYSRMVNNPEGIPLIVGDPVAQPHTCIIYFALETTISGAESRKVLYEDGKNYSRVKCFE